MLLGLLALALVDSINPSAIVVTLYLLSGGRVPAQIMVYVAAILLTYLTLGVIMMSGIDALLPSLETMGSGRPGLIVQAFNAFCQIALEPISDTLFTQTDNCGNLTSDHPFFTG